MSWAEQNETAYYVIVALFMAVPIIWLAVIVLLVKFQNPMVKVKKQK